MKKRTTRWLVGATLAIAAIGVTYHLSATPAAQAQQNGRRGMDMAGRPVPVAAASAHSGDIDVVITALGTVTARNTTTVKARVDGMLERIRFREGQQVKAGEVLADIDARPFQVALDQANGQLAKDQALLVNARLDLERYQGLLAKDSIARQQVDTQEALVRQYEGVVQADRGQAASAKLQLDFTRVTAPISGRLGLRQVDVGNMVHAGDVSGIVVITQTQPIDVVFAIPSDSLGAVMARVSAGETLQVEAWNREGKAKLATGTLLTVDNQIDVATGTVKLKAAFPNTDGALFPNLFVNARLRVETRSGATLIPPAAIQRGTQGSFVYVVDPADQTVSLRPVTLGPSDADNVAIDKGLKPGEQVVVDGTDKLRQGAKVEVATPGARDAARSAPNAGEKGTRKRRKHSAPAAGE